MDGNADTVHGSSDETYAQRTACGLTTPEEQAVFDAINNANGEALGPPPRRQRRLVTNFEEQHFHPLNVTSERPCSAFFRASEDYPSKAFIDSFVAIGIPITAVKCLQRRSTCEAMVTFYTED